MEEARHCSRTHSAGTLSKAGDTNGCTAYEGRYGQAAARTVTSQQKKFGLEQMDEEVHRVFFCNTELCEFNSAEMRFRPALRASA